MFFSIPGERILKGDENSQRPITNRQPATIRPHMRWSTQYEIFDIHRMKSASPEWQAIAAGRVRR